MIQPPVWEGKRSFYRIQNNKKKLKSSLSNEIDFLIWVFTEDLSLKSILEP